MAFERHECKDARGNESCTMFKEQDGVSIAVASCCNYGRQVDAIASIRGEKARVEKM